MICNLIYVQLSFLLSRKTINYEMIFLKFIKFHDMKVARVLKSIKVEFFFLLQNQSKLSET